ncbi:MAG: aminotransferase [Clostridia bacterium]|nr:aminotransferase [Clostridia bacterium]MBR5383992.1 aminotransferase [Clostridia bacterium]
MKIRPFAVEEWMNAYEENARYNIAETCVDSISVRELLQLCGVDEKAFLENLCSRRLTYGDILGAPALKQGICGLYRTLQPDEIVTTHGAAGANHHLFYSLVEPGDRVISVMPTYQQLYSIPESLGAEVLPLCLRPENSWLPDPDELRGMAAGGVKMICINNPNNPTGALMNETLLREIIEIARSAGAYLMCDEVYRHLTQEDGWSPSVADLYEKGISVSGMSKVFSMAGLRLGWIATHDRDAMRSILSHRDYDHISCGMLDEALAAAALEHADRILGRNRRIVRENLGILDAWIKGEPHLSYIRPQAGTTALVNYDFDMSSYDFCRRMFEETGAFVTPGDCFEQPRSMRIGYACDREVLRQGLDAMSRFIALLTGESD